MVGRSVLIPIELVCAGYDARRLVAGTAGRNGWRNLRSSGCAGRRAKSKSIGAVVASRHHNVGIRRRDVGAAVVIRRDANDRVGRRHRDVRSRRDAGRRLTVQRAPRAASD
jgi:hypothetical protein